MKFYIKISILLLIFQICIPLQHSFSQQNTSGWYWVNGQPQSNDLNWVKIIDDTHYYAVGENGTFMKSSDGGDSWLINSQAGVLDPTWGSGSTLRLYSAWFFNANTGILVGQSVTNDGGKIRRTTDGGQTFTTIGLGIPTSSTLHPPRITDIYFINSTTGYICGNNIVKSFKTTDAGLSWTLLPNLPNLPNGPNTSGLFNCVYAKDVNNIFFGVATDGYPSQRRIVRTINAGTTWKIDTLPGSTIVDIKDIEFQNANTGYVCGNSVATNPSYFAYTTNGGSNWTESIFPNKEHGLYDLQVVGSTTYVLGGNFHHYYYTSNLGVTWDSVDYHDPSNVYQPQRFVYAFNFIGNDVIVGGQYGKLNISNDGGSSWRNKNYSVDYNLVTWVSIYAQPGTGNVWTASNIDGGYIMRSTNRGTNWALSSTGANKGYENITMANSNTGYAVGGDSREHTGYCYKTVNGGVSWTSLPIPNPYLELLSADFVDANTGWAVGGSQGGTEPVISKTTNGGTTWISQFVTPLEYNEGKDIDMYDANTGYLVGYFDGHVWKTTNGGNNWNIINNLPATILSAVKTFSNTTVFVGGGQSIYKSFDGGVTWNSFSIPSTLPNITNMDWSDLNNGTVVGTTGYTAKTRDGGLTWTERNTGTSTLMGVSMASKDTVFATCDRNVWGAIFRLYDNNTSISFNLTIGIQGFWDGTTQVGDTVKCHLRNSTSPYAEVEVAAAVINNSGEGTFNFNTASSGSYYLEITQRNSLETWSGLPQTVVQGGNYNYNFTTSASQAFGNNMILKSGRYCNYSGDVSQEGTIDLTDIIDVFNDGRNFVIGYVKTDINGDLQVNLSDLLITYNNATNFVDKVTP